MNTCIDLTCGPFRARIGTHGACLMGLWHERHPKSLVLGFRDSDDYEKVPIYAGAIVGPVANRIADGSVTIDGQYWQMPRNEKDQTCLHSGEAGLHVFDWSVVQQDPASVTLRAELPHGACGLPGSRVIDVVYRLTESRVTLEISARTDRKTLMNIAHHPYWIVDADSLLHVAADAYLPVDANLIPTGEIAPVAETPFDLRRAAPIPPLLDHNFVLGSDPSETLRLAAELTTNAYTLRVHTTSPGLQVYAGAGLPTISEERMVSGPLAPNSAIALEAQLWPDAPHHASFPSITLSAGETWKQITTYSLDCS